MKLSCPWLLAATLSVSTLSTTFAQHSSTPPPASSTPPPLHSAPQPELRSEPKSLRPAYGMFVSVFGGANVHQSYEDSNLEAFANTLGNAFEYGFNAKNKVTGFGGARLGYTWDPTHNLWSDNPKPYYEKPSSWLVEVFGEGMYTGYTTTGPVPNDLIVPTTINAKTNLDFAVFTANGVIKYPVEDWFMPYVGLGFGFSYARLSSSRTDYNVNGTQTVVTGSDDDWTFAAKGIAGLEFIVDEQWSLFGEYDFLYLHDVRFETRGNAFDFDHIGMHMVGGGVKYYY